MVNFGCEKWLLNKKGFSRLAPGAFRYCLGRELSHYAICISLDLPHGIPLVLDLQLSLENALKVEERERTNADMRRKFILPLFRFHSLHLSPP